MNAFELWCWRILVRVLWTARRSNQSVLEAISLEYSLEGLMLKLKFQILWPPGTKNWLLKKTLNLGKIEGGRRGQQRMKGTTVGWHYRLDGCEFQQALGSWWWTGKPGVLQSMGWQRVGQDWTTELPDWLNFHTEFHRVWESPEIVYRVDVSMYFSAFVLFPRVVLVIP